MKHAREYRALQVKEVQAGDRMVTHATYSAYTQGCRCEQCKDAARQYQREYRARRREEVLTEARVIHTGSGSYGYGCRCVECKAANFVIDQKIPLENIGVIVGLYRDHDGKCKICGSEEKLQIDHDHETGSIRGLLCGRCNRGLGLFRDSVDYLEGAVRYLKEESL